MGDRANVIVKDGDDQVCLYTHWDGSELPTTVQSAMKRGEDRLDDYQYLTRIVFCEMVKGQEMKLTGFGITHKVGDGSERIIELDVDKKTVKIRDSPPVTFEDFLSLETVDWS